MICSLSDAERSHISFLFLLRIGSQINDYQNYKELLEHSYISDDKRSFQGDLDEICRDLFLTLSCCKSLGIDWSRAFTDSACSLIKECAEIGEHLDN